MLVGRTPVIKKLGLLRPRAVILRAHRPYVSANTATATRSFFRKPARIAVLPLAGAVLAFESYEYFRNLLGFQKGSMGQFLHGVRDLLSGIDNYSAQAFARDLRDKTEGKYHHSFDGTEEPLPSAPTTSSDIEHPAPQPEDENLLNTDQFLDKKEELHDLIERLQEQLENAYIRHQGELLEERDRLQRHISDIESENKELRTNFIKLYNDRGGLASESRFKRRSAIELYSNILTILENYHRDYNTQDNLPRIVVIGDQSAGKTSVLEMICKARLFPRGHGEMMTKSPIQVTLSEGPFQVASFPDQRREYNLNSETELEELRKEISKRMASNILPGDTVSRTPISLNVKGPGVPRMVLVDLPGVINHVTKGMSANTKDDIWGLCKNYMRNPNAIILCVQDGSVDAERSSVADLISEVDPSGNRTIFVLTKTDLAEKNGTAPERIRDIMEGKLFRMNALGYFAVVTGTSNKEETIEEIKDYEEKFFKTSRLFREGVLRPHQTTTQNLARGVSQEFWKLVRVSIEEQLERIKNDIFELEQHRKNTYKGRMLTREELFQLGKYEILENFDRVNKTPSKEWEETIGQQIWSSLSSYFLHDIYLRISQDTNHVRDFKTKVDLALFDWASKDLPERIIEQSKLSVLSEFKNKLDQHLAVTSNLEESELLRPFLQYIMNQTQEIQGWGKDTVETLRVLLSHYLHDDDNMDPGEWLKASLFMQQKLSQERSSVSCHAEQLFGPGLLKQYTAWSYKTEDQVVNSLIKNELHQFFEKDGLPPKRLSDDDLLVVRSNLKRHKQTAQLKDAKIIEIFDFLYQKKFIELGLASAGFCMKRYNVSDQDEVLNAPNGLGCKDIMMFWKFSEVMNASLKTLRHQSTSSRNRLEEDVKSFISAVEENEELKKTLFSSPRVDLAEQIDTTKGVIKELEALISMLKTLPASSGLLS